MFFVFCFVLFSFFSLICVHSTYFVHVFVVHWFVCLFHLFPSTRVWFCFTFTRAVYVQAFCLILFLHRLFFSVSIYFVLLVDCLIFKSLIFFMFNVVLRPSSRRHSLSFRRAARRSLRRYHSLCLTPPHDERVCLCSSSVHYCLLHHFVAPVMRRPRRAPPRPALRVP